MFFPSSGRLRLAALAGCADWASFADGTEPRFLILGRRSRERVRSSLRAEMGVNQSLGNECPRAQQSRGSPQHRLAQRRHLRRHLRRPAPPRPRRGRCGGVAVVPARVGHARLRSSSFLCILTATRVTTPRGTPSLSETPEGQSRDGRRAACTLLSGASGKRQLLTGCREGTKQFRTSSGFPERSKASPPFLNRTSPASQSGRGKRAGDESDASRRRSRREKVGDRAGEEGRKPSCPPSPSTRGQPGPRQRAALGCPRR